MGRQSITVEYCKILTLCCASFAFNSIPERDNNDETQRKISGSPMSSGKGLTIVLQDMFPRQNNLTRK